MQLLNTSSNYVLPVNSSETALTRNTGATQPQLSIIWVKEFDEEHPRLVVRWVQQD